MQGRDRLHTGSIPDAHLVRYLGLLQRGPLSLGSADLAMLRDHGPFRHLGPFLGCEDTGRDLVRTRVTGALRGGLDWMVQDGRVGFGYRKRKTPQCGRTKGGDLAGAYRYTSKHRSCLCRRLPVPPHPLHRGVGTFPSVQGAVSPPRTSHVMGGAWGRWATRACGIVNSRCLHARRWCTRTVARPGAAWSHSEL